MSFARLGRVTGALTLAALTAGVAAGCGSKSSNTLTVGDIVPLTGDLAPFGPPGEKAARLAVEQANAALKQDGIKLTVKLDNADEQTNSAASVSAARKLISDGASCIAGAWASSDTIPVSQSVTSREHVPQISPASTAATISTLKTGYIFRTSPSDNLQGKLLAEYVSESIPRPSSSTSRRRTPRLARRCCARGSSTPRNCSSQTASPCPTSPPAV